MAGEVKRSGFSTPANANFAASTAKPSEPTELAVHSWGVQPSGEPDEKPRIVLKFKAPTTKVVTIEDAAGDDVYSVVGTVGAVSGTYGANDTVLTLAAPASPELHPNDKIRLGLDTTNYTVVSADDSEVVIKYGLLAPIPGPSVDIFLLEKVAPCPANSRKLRVNAGSNSLVKIDGAFGFDYRIGWTALSSLAEWDDLNTYTIDLNDLNRGYYVRDSFAQVVGDVIVGGRTIPTSSSLVGIVSPGQKVSFGERPGELYTVAGVEAGGIVIVEPLLTSILNGDGVWREVAGAFGKYDQLDLTSIVATRLLATGDVLGFRFYWSFEPISDTLAGANLIGFYNLSNERLALGTDGLYYLTYDAPDHSWAGERVYFAVSCVDSSIPANVSAPDVNAWAIFAPRQVRILSSSVAGLEMAVTYSEVTDGGLNRHLREMMGGDFMGMTSYRGGYDVLKVPYVALFGTGSYVVGATEADARFVDPNYKVDDVVVVFDANTGDQWATVCIKDGEVYLSDAVLVFSPNGTGAPYSGANCKHNSENMSSKHGRMTSRDANSVLERDSQGRKLYLTDLSNTHVVTLDAGLDQGVVMESVDTETGSGKL